MSKANIPESTHLPFVLNSISLNLTFKVPGNSFVKKNLTQHAQINSPMAIFAITSIPVKMARELPSYENNAKRGDIIISITASGTKSVPIKASNPVMALMV